MAIAVAGKNVPGSVSTTAGTLTSAAEGTASSDPSRMASDQRTAFAVRAMLADQPPRRIAVFRALFLGDLLCATPAFRALRRRFPEAEITLIGHPWAADLVGRLPSLDRLEVFPGFPGILEVPCQPERTAAFLAGARAKAYDLALQLHGDGHVSNGFVAALGAPISAGYRLGPDDRLTLALPWDPDEHETLRWLRLAGALGAEADDLRPEFPITAAERERARALLAGAPKGAGPLVGLHPGGKDPARRWPAERFAALGDRLAARHGARVVLTGSEAEGEVTAAVRRAMRAPALDLAGGTDMATFAAAIAGLDLLVTNDTGASHLAAASGTPSVVLFGPTAPDRWAPLDRCRHRVIDARALAGDDVDPAVALAQLPVAPVSAACDEMLRQPGGHGQGDSGRVAPPLLTHVPDAEAVCRG